MAARVLALIEDQSQSKAIAICLLKAGHFVYLAENFSKAKTVLLGQDPFDLILSDVHLQNGGNIFDFLKWAKCDPLFRAIPFVLLSVEPSETAKYLSEGVRIAARQFGAAKYVNLEVFDPVSLMYELEEYLPKLHESILARKSLSKY